MVRVYVYNLFVLGFVFFAITCCYGESSTCLAVYKEGGAPAVFRSPKCPRWKPWNYASGPRSQTARCQSALHQGRRRYQEDRILCNLDIRISLPGPAGITEVTAGIVAIFDGHNGVEASEMASKQLIEYFMLHTYFLIDTTFSYLLRNGMGRLPGNELNFQKVKWDEELQWDTFDLGRLEVMLSAISDGSFHLEILKEALLRAIHDTDAAFSKEAYRKNFNSGSTATVILLAEGQILVANVGDSKAFLCSETFQSPPEAKATLLRLHKQNRAYGYRPVKGYGSLRMAASNGWVYFSPKELTRDHHPDRDDERFRVESAGGHVSEWGGVSRVNGQLAVSRSIGDVSFKSYGVTSVPEVTDWQPLTVNDSYLVASSDGIFDKLSPQEVCDILWEAHTNNHDRSELTASCSYSLAECLVNIAFERGSTDNMAAVVIPLNVTDFSQTLQKQRFDGGARVDSSVLRLPKYTYEQPVVDSTSELIPCAHPVNPQLGRLLVDRKQYSFGCFYLSENLDEDDNYIFEVQKGDPENMYGLLHAIPDSLNHQHGESIKLYNDQDMCLHFGMSIDGDKNQCINSEGFARFLGLLESIPLNSNHGSNEHAIPDSRYILKKRFGRGAFGEVWLAFHWNCSQAINVSNWLSKDNKFPINTFHLDNNKNEQRGKFACDCGACSSGDNVFILKRIMVEKGTNTYLSGLREKYFGEVFLNASTFLCGPPSAEAAEFFWEAPQADITNESFAQEYDNSWSYKTSFPRNTRPRRAVCEEGLNHIARYIESFESRSNEMWLVFRHEGVSLSKLLYTAEELTTSVNEENNEHVESAQLLRPSKWWHWLKTTEAGQKEMCNLIRQLLIALKSCHDRNITHRDIKPENMVICFEDQISGRCLKGSPAGERNYTTKMRIIDFGSAMDEFTRKHFYGSAGPSRAEQTYEYSPPEAFLNASWYQASTSTTLKYDMWSVGIVMLEMILGSPNVFQISVKSRVLLDQHLAGWNEEIKELAYKLRAFMEMCILIPGGSSKHQRTWGSNNQDAVSPASWRCSEEFFSLLIKSRDPLNIGFPNVWAMRLVRQLLLWNPEDRLNVEDALQHPYFFSCVKEKVD